MQIEIETVGQLETHLESHGHLRGVVVQGLDLRGHTGAITRAPVAGAVFLGCELEHRAADHVHATGGLLFPRIPELPYQPYRQALYSVAELIDGYRRGDPASFAECYDQRVYRHYDRLRRAPGPLPIMEALAQRLHDHAIDDALDDYLHGADPKRVVAIMGGHAMARTDPSYRTVARISQLLSSRGFLMASGGGPGAMEATHLGAWLGNGGEAELDRALGLLAAAPDYEHPAWLDTALAVRDELRNPRPSLGVPTWFYGHEPANLFATHIAKYFSNSLREDGLLAIARHGVIYSPGSAGTVQEIFMDAAQNHYGTFGDISPMVFFGTTYWTETKPVYPLLRQLASGRHYLELLAISDDAEEIVELIASRPPVAYRG